MVCRLSQTVLALRPALGMLVAWWQVAGHGGLWAEALARLWGLGTVAFSLRTSAVS